MSRVGMHLSRVALVGAIALGCITTWQVPARAGSDNSNDTYAGDVTLFSLPPGTLIASEYVGFRMSPPTKTFSASSREDKRRFRQLSTCTRAYRD
jgi:hypothetical protein